jgi:hypothetical protein
MLMNPAAGASTPRPPAAGANPMASALRGGNAQTGMSGTGMVNAGPSLNAYAGQGIQTDLNTRGLPAMPVADAAERQRIEGALFDRMRPEHQQSQEALEGKLSRMGLARGSEAWNREAQRLGDQQARERFNALEMGGQEMQRLFGMGLQGRQQGFNEALGAGQFHNQAQEQGFGQRNAGISGDFNRALAAGGQNYNQGMETARFDETVRGNRINEARTARRDPIEEYNLMTQGISPVTSPNFSGGPNGRVSGQIDYTQAGTQGYGGDVDRFNYNEGRNDSLLRGLYGMYGMDPSLFGQPSGGQPPGQGYNMAPSYNMGDLGPQYL